MKKVFYLLFAASMFTFASCESNTENRAEEVQEESEDAAEEAGDEIEDAADETEDAAENTTGN
jgi:protein involved in sex pheromone biosynthesis